VKKRSSIGLRLDLDRFVNLFSGSLFLYETFRTFSWQPLCPPNLAYLWCSSTIADFADPTYQPSQDQPPASPSSHQ
jgi:hypothetical protein